MCWLILHECSRSIEYILNELGKHDKMPGLLSILALFFARSDKFNNIGAGMLDSFYQMTLKLFCNWVVIQMTLKLFFSWAFGVKSSIF